MKNYIFRLLLALVFAVGFCFHCSGQRQFSVTINGKSIDNSELKIYFVSKDTNNIIEVPNFDKNIFSEKVVSEFMDSVWMVIVKYKDDFYKIGICNAMECERLNPELEIIFLSRGFRRVYNEIKYLDKFTIIWNNFTTYSLSTQSSWKTKRQCTKRSREIVERALKAKSTTE